MIWIELNKKDSTDNKIKKVDIYEVKCGDIPPSNNCISVCDDMEAAILQNIMLNYESNKFNKANRH